MRKPPDYEKIESRMWKKHAKEVVGRLVAEEQNLLRRIKTYSNRFGYSDTSVRDKIKTDKMFAAHFAKEPRRTNFHEKEAMRWLDKVSAIENIERLSPSGGNAFYITSDGNVEQGMNNPPTKSLDFRWRTDEYTVYASHKYTREGGGNQDSQFREVRRLLELFQKGNEKKSTILLAIVDGPYYNDAKMDDLKRFWRHTPPLSDVMPIQEVPLWLERICQREQAP